MSQAKEHCDPFEHMGTSVLWINSAYQGNGSFPPELGVSSCQLPVKDECVRCIFVSGSNRLEQVLIPARHPSLRHPPHTHRMIRSLDGVSSPTEDGSIASHTVRQEVLAASKTGEMVPFSIGNLQHNRHQGSQSQKGD